MSRTLTAAVHLEEDIYVARALEVASQGETIDEALRNLREALELYFEDVDPAVPALSHPLVTTLEIDVA